MQALIIAAGAGTRQRENGESKPLIPLKGQTIIERVISSCKEANIKEIFITVGYKADKIKTFLGDGSQLGLKITYIDNSEWEKGNGTSVYCAKNIIKTPFILLMSDHIFDSTILKKLQEKKYTDDECLLCVDKKPKGYLDVDDATKVLIEGDTIIAINKKLVKYNGIDTGIFLSTSAMFEALEESILMRKYSLSDANQILADERRLKAVDVSDYSWIDIDDDMGLKNAEKLLREESL